MKKFFLSFFLLVSFLASAQQNGVATPYAQWISPSELKDNLSIIASDALEGRYTGSPRPKKAPGQDNT